MNDSMIRGRWDLIGCLKELGQPLEGKTKVYNSHIHHPRVTLKLAFFLLVKTGVFASVELGAYSCLFPMIEIRF